MLRSAIRARRVPGLMMTAGGLAVAVACSAPAPTALPHSRLTRPASPSSVAAGAAVVRLAGRTISAPQFTGMAFPVRAAGWLLAAAEPGTRVARAEVWHTATAGSAWRVQWRGQGNPLSITATDPRHAWALVGCPGPPYRQSCRTALLATTSAGRHWRMITRLPRAVTQVRFASASVGIATANRCQAQPAGPLCAGRVLVSHDGGTSWARVLRSARPVFATASATGQLWAAEAIPGAQITFITSTDGGRSWQRLGQLSGIGPLGVRLQVALAAGPAGLTWASVFDPDSCAMHGCGVAGLFHSADGGRSWASAAFGESLASACGNDGIVFSAAPGGTVWAATGRNAGACAPPFGLLYREGPGGWQQLPPWQLSGVSSLAATGRDSAYALGSQGVLARTDDGGQRWTQLLPAPTPAGQVEALSASTALAAQDASDAGAVLRTTDGGRSWHQVAGLPGVVTRLDFPDARDGVAVTFQAGRRPLWRLWRSRDGGLTWHPAARLLPRIKSGNVGLYGPWMASDGHGVLLTVAASLPWEELGSGGNAPVRVWTTGDWGARWSRGSLLPIGSDTLNGAVSFAPSGPGGWAGWLAVTAMNGPQRIEGTAGTGRALTPLPGSPPAGNVQLIRPGAGYAWGVESTSRARSLILSLYRTEDNGRHWQHIKLALPAGSPGPPLLDFTGTGHGWLVEGSTTWHTSDGGRTWQRADRLSRRGRRSVACRRRTPCRSGCTCPARARLPAGCSGGWPWFLP